MGISRRTTLGLLAAGGVATAIGIFHGLPSRLVGAARPLNIPKLYKGTLVNGVREYDLNMQKGISNFATGLKTPTLGINQDYLGPTLDFTAGEKVRLNVTNKIGEVSTLHWHGMHLPAIMDGGPHQAIADGGSWHPEFEVRQRASTLWYHAHTMHKTGTQVYHGLAGLMLVRDEASDHPDLPRDYGVDDIPVILQDRVFAPDGALIYDNTGWGRDGGMQGNTLLVNGTLNPFIEPKSGLLRLRLLNASNVRIYGLGFSDQRKFHQISSDGGLLEAPVAMSQIILTPGERADIVVDISDGVPVWLQSVTANPAPDTGGKFMTWMMTNQDDFDVLHIRPHAPAKAIVVPTNLVKLPVVDAGKAVKTRRFVLSMEGGGAHADEMTINGKSMDIDVINERVKVNTSEIWEVVNDTMHLHPFHIHDVQFRILDVNDNPPKPGDRGLKDVVAIPTGVTVRLLLEFSDFTDNKLPYMYHCHVLEHEDAGMMGQFTVEA